MAQGGMLDEIFIKMGVKVDSKELEKLNKQFEKTVKSAANVAKNSKGGKSLDGLMKGLKQFNSLIPKGGGELGRFANGLSKVAGLAGGAAGAVGLAVAGVVALGGVVVATTVKLDKMVMSLAKANQFYLNFAQQTNTGIGTLNKYAGVAMLSNMNMSAEQVANSLQTIDSKLAEIRLTGQGAAEFQMLGISPWGKNSGDIIEDLRGKIAGLDNATASNLIQKMGLTPEWLGILRMSSDEFQKLTQSAREFQLNPSQLKEMNALGLEIRQMQMRLEYLKQRILIAIGPLLIKMTKPLAKFVEQLDHIVEASAKGLSVISQIPDKFKAIGESLKIIMAVANPLITVVRALWLVLEDFAVFALGGNSVIGDAINGIQQFINDSGITDFSNGIGGIFENLANFGQQMDWVNVFSSAVNTFIRGTSALLGIKQPTDGSTGGASALQNGYIGELPPLANPTTNYNSGDTNNKISYNQTNYTTVQGGSREMANNANDLMFAFMQAQTVV